MTNKVVVPSIPGSVNGILDEAVQNGVGLVYTIHALKADGSSYGDLTGYVITGVKQDTKGNTSSITGTLAWSDAENAIFTWTLSAADVGTADEFGVYFTFTSGGVGITTKRLVWKVQRHPAANVVAAPGVTGVSVAEGAWLTQAVEAGEEASGGNLVQWNNDGTLADSGRAKTEIGNATQIRSRPVADVVPTDGQVLTFDAVNGWQPETPAGGGVTDHGALSGLADDDHTQYVKKASNLSDLTDAAAARSAIGAGTGNGDVTAASTFGTDNRVLRSDGTGKGVQASGATLDDSSNLTVGATLNVGGATGAAGRLDLFNNTVGVRRGGNSELILYAHGGDAAIVRGQRLGIGTPAGINPDGKVHSYDTGGGFMHVYKSGVNGSATTVIPDAAGDVTKCLTGHFTIEDGAGNTAAGTITKTVPGGTFDLYDDGGTNTCQLQISAGGAVTVIRTAGSRTYVVNLTLNWM